ncbi:MAG: cobalamin-dependent protein [Desulfobacterales bacterium]
MTHREKVLNVFRGKVVDTIPWIPRIDLWHNANALAGTLPKKYRDYSVEDIHRAEGWPLHKMIPEYLKPEKPADIVHRAIGLYRLKEFPYDFEFSGDVEIETAYEDSAEESMTRVSYHTPVGTVSVRHGTTAEMQKSGASVTWVKEHAVKTKDDYHILAHVFNNLKLKPAYERFKQWQDSVGEDGVAVAHGLGIACSSPMHFIQKTLLGATEFYLHYHDYPKEMAELVEALEPVYNQLIEILAESPADAVMWSANIDDMVTYSTYFEKDILPWCRKAAQKLHAKGILTIIHPDGENRGLMDLIPRCEMDVADAVTPYPMTKIDIEEYYERGCRSGRMTIHGGIPEMLLLEESATREDLKQYLDHLFKVITPGTRFAASIGDTCPPNAEFDRLLYIGERIEKEGRLPLKAGGYDPVSVKRLAKAAKSEVSQSPRPAAVPPGGDDLFKTAQQIVLAGDVDQLVDTVAEMLSLKIDPREILNLGMLSALEIIGERFKDGTVFIPEVLLSARALNEALKVLEPHLAGSQTGKSARILVGTVLGDLHDIGKNMVLTMLKGVGYETVDLGVNVRAEKFVQQVSEHQPQLLGLSALLTTTMPQMKLVINALEEAGLRDRLKVIVGGAPVNAKFARDIGADGYARDGGEAITLVKSLLAE